MRRLGPALALLLAACGDGRGPPARDLEIRIEADRGEVDLGRAFPLSVFRAWDRALAPEPWDDGSLAPLRVRPLSVERTERAGRVEETRRYAARAFSLDEVRVPPPRIRAGGREAAGRGLSLRVRPALDPRSPGEPEPAGPPPAPPRRLPGWLPAAAAALLAAGALALLRARRLGIPERDPATRRALARIAALRPAGEPGPFHDELDGLLREYLAARHGLRTRERTTEEILASPAAERALGRDGLAALAGLLGRCDLARYAGARPGPAGQEAAARDAAALVGSRP